MVRKTVTPKSEQANFLLQSYNNTQQAIQFFDTKAGAFIAGNGIAVSLLVNTVFPYMGELLSVDRSLLSKNLNGVLFGMLFFFILLALWSIYETSLVFLKSFLVLSPKSGYKFIKKGSAKGLFWVADIKDFVEKTSVDHYAETMTNLTTNEIVEELAFETAKLSYIASEKLNHLGSATRHFQRAIILWGISLLTASLSKFLFQYINILQ